MAPRCLPADPELESGAERTVWQALVDQLPDDVVLLANLALTSRRGDHEADLVVVWPDHGIAVIEVKGGAVTVGADGWRQRGGGADKRIDPVLQAKRCKYALRDFINARTSLHNTRMAHLVAVPYSAVADDFASPDCERWMVLDRTDLEVLAEDRIRSALGRTDGGSALGAAHADQLVELLTQRPGSEQDLLGSLSERADEVDLLTGRQASLLRQLRSNRLLEVRGGAGTGKTFLAVEQARRLTREGRRVAFVCYSRGLARFLQRRFESLAPDERPAYVGTFHSLGVDWGLKPRTNAPPRYWEEEAPAQMLALAPHLQPAQRFDALVVDEAQDFADTWWPALEAGLRDPEGAWRAVFTDHAQRVFDRHGSPQGLFTVVQLDENLRNTRPIARSFEPLAGEQMQPRGPQGPPVRFVSCPTTQAVGCADDEVVRLLEEGWPAASVALLTTYHRHPQQVMLQQSRGPDGYWDTFWDGDDAFYGHVLGFKGLERPAVVLAVDGFRDADLARQMLYVGMSRARDLLVVCADPELVRARGGDELLDRLGG